MMKLFEQFRQWRKEPRLSRGCALCAEVMGRYVDTLKQRIAELEEQRDVLLRCLENDYGIKASWDGLRKFWCIELTEDGLRMRDAAYEAVADVNAALGGGDYERMYRELTGAVNELQKKQPYCYNPNKPVETLQTIGRFIDELNAALGSEECEQILMDCEDGLMPPFTAYCSACGAEWGFTPKFCPNCGAKVTGTRDERKAVR